MADKQDVWKEWRALIEVRLEKAEEESKSGFTGKIKKLLGKQQRHLACLLIGPIDSGKTSLLYQLKLGETVTTVPTRGTVNCDTINYKHHTFTIGEIGGADAFTLEQTPQLKHVNVPVYPMVVVDANNRESFPDAKRLIDQVIAHPSFKKLPLLVWANKDDMPNAAPISEVAEALGLEKLDSRRWHVQKLSVVMGETKEMHEGLDFILKSLQLDGAAHS